MRNAAGLPELHAAAAAGGDRKQRIDEASDLSGITICRYMIYLYLYILILYLRILIFSCRYVEVFDEV